MFVQSLPKTFNPANEITPQEYTDHLLFFEHLRTPYECAEFPANIGLLTTTVGTCTYTVNGSRNDADSQKVFFVSRGSSLALKGRDTGTGPALLFFRSKLPDLVLHSLNYGGEVLLEKPFDSLPYDFSYLQRMHVSPILHQTIVSLIALGSSCGSFSSLQADMIIRQLFEDLLLRNMDAYKHSQNVQAVKASTRLEIFKRVSTARDWMDAHYNTGITLEDIGAVAAMNSQHFLRMFKQVYNITPHQYLIDLKLRHAKQLLESTDLTINEICQAIGLESVFSFSVLFKGRFGLPPSQYKNIHFR